MAKPFTIHLTGEGLDMALVVASYSDLDRVKGILDLLARDMPKTNITRIRAPRRAQEAQAPAVSQQELDGLRETVQDITEAAEGKA